MNDGRNDMNGMKIALLSLMIGMSFAGIYACPGNGDGPAEDVGEKIDDTVEDAGDKAEDAVD